MLKFNKSTMIGLYAMTELAEAGEEPLTVAEIATRFHASKHHLAKVLQQLVRAKLVVATRGAAGGHRLARDPGEITLLDIVEVFEGPQQEDELCLLLEEQAKLTERADGRPRCRLHPVFEELDQQLLATLGSISLRTILSQSEG
jgi:Rrf2 family protein